MIDFSNLANERPLKAKEVKSTLKNRKEFQSSGESRHLELKQTLASSGQKKREHWVKLLAETASMANAGGGYILFGVSDDGVLVGISDGVVEMLDPTRFQDQVNRYSPNCSLSTQLTTTEYYGKKYACLWVRPSKQVVIFDKDGNYQDENGGQSQAFKSGVVYTRDEGGRRRASQNELAKMMRDWVDRRLSSVVAKIEQVVHLPSEADLLAVNPESPSQAYRLVSEGEGQPVRISTNPDEPAVPLHEVFDTDVPYGKLENEIRSQVRFWNAKPSHRVSRSSTYEWYLNRDRVNWDKELSEFCLLSACSDWGYPMFWANNIYQSKRSYLLNIINSFLSSPSHPEIEYVPYLVGSFFWDKKDEILERVEETGYSQASRTAQKIREFSTKKDFIIKGRYTSPTIDLGGDRFVKEELLQSRDIAVRLLERVVNLRLNDGSSDQISTKGHQLDMICHAAY